MSYIILNFIMTRQLVVRRPIHFVLFISLNLEISDNLKHLKFVTSNIYRLTRTIKNNFPIYICNQFFTTQHRSLKKLFEKKKIKLNKKLIWCSSNNYFHDYNNNISNINNIKNINYVCSIGGSNSHNGYTVSLHGSNNYSILASSKNICKLQIDN